MWGLAASKFHEPGRAFVGGWVESSVDFEWDGDWERATLCHEISVKFEIQIFKIHFAILSFEFSPHSVDFNRQPFTYTPHFDSYDTMDDEFPKMSPPLRSRKLDAIEHEHLQQ